MVTRKEFDDHQLVLWDDMNSGDCNTYSLTHWVAGKVYASANTHIVALEGEEAYYTFSIEKEHATNDDLLRLYKEGKTVDLGTLDGAFVRTFEFAETDKLMHKYYMAINAKNEKKAQEYIEELYRIYIY
ncbi:hypothetical protein [Lactobacillus helveticus]|uniref:Uncharacterized protein n=1 Tax=Lactobacillus helveticus CIRM-BIA 953 TaxID=1226335 RepID=U4QFD4_LACHE|nr:hypothetical protein [Lactobacillus helveticus]CDI43272.1 Protein of unknown function [Lactobacillus helveticus CIRM-BIA 953]CDI43354.1 Protein of unknown function [Lactobacillus helveticus CIRM-BIA 953]